MTNRRRVELIPRDQLPPPPNGKYYNAQRWDITGLMINDRVVLLFKAVPGDPIPDDHVLLGEALWPSQIAKLRQQYPVRLVPPSDEETYRNTYGLAHPLGE